MVIKIFETNRDKLTKLEKNLWADVRRYGSSTGLNLLSGSIFTPLNLTKPCLDLVTDEFRGFRIGFQNEEKSEDNNVSEYVLPGQIYLEISHRYQNLSGQIRTFAIGKEKVKVKKIQDALEELTNNHGYINMVYVTLCSHTTGRYSCKVGDIERVDFLKKVYDAYNDNFSNF